MLRYRLSRPWLTAHRALRRFRTRPAPGFRVLLLHDVPDAHLSDLDRLLAHVKAHHGLLAPDEAGAWLEGKPPAGAEDAERLPCLITFDDGFASNLTAARQVLSRHGVQALFFVCPGLVDLPGPAQREAVAAQVFLDRPGSQALAAERRLMTWEELAELQSMGHTVGAHGMSHRRLSGLGGAELRREILGSGEALEQKLHAPVDWYAYAFGDIASISREALEVVAEKYRFCRSGVRGANTLTTNRHAVRGDEINLAAPLSYWQLILEGGLDGRYADARARLDGLIGG